jgi:hypothetical protein
MDEELLKNARRFADRCGRVIGEPLGFGIHGIVVVLKSQRNTMATALKVLSDPGPYRRERDIYERLKEARVTKVLGFHVPQLLSYDDSLLAVEMTVVAPPYVLDFAGAYLDFPPSFSEEVWAEWEVKNQEQFGEDWAQAKAILRELEELRVFMLDPSPSNIRFR